MTVTPIPSDTQSQVDEDLGRFARGEPVPWIDSSMFHGRLDDDDTPAVMVHESFGRVVRIHAPGSR